MTEPSPLHHKSNVWGWSRQFVYSCLLSNYLVSDNRLLPNWMEHTLISPFVPFGLKFPHHKWDLSTGVYMYGAGIGCIIHIHCVHHIIYTLMLVCMWIEREVTNSAVLSYSEEKLVWRAKSKDKSIKLHKNDSEKKDRKWCPFPVYVSSFLPPLLQKHVLTSCSLLGMV